ncbi:MAG: SH3 domain-containing protein [Caldilineaceae bacterium]
MLTLVGVLALAAFAACTPLDPSMTMGQSDAPAGPGAEATAPAAEEAAAPEGTGAMATVATRSLRVRSAPNPDAEVVAGVREGETYPVVDLSSDGEWVLLAVPAAPDGQGWVAANLVSINGTLSGSADAILVPTPAAAGEATPAPAEEAATGDAATDDAATIEVPVPDPGFAVVVTDGTRLRVRAEPTTDSDIVGYVYAGEVYEVLGTSDDGVWVQIAGSTEAVSDNPDGGWVAAEFLVVGQ